METEVLTQLSAVPCVETVSTLTPVTVSLRKSVMSRIPPRKVRNLVSGLDCHAEQGRNESCLGQGVVLSHPPSRAEDFRGKSGSCRCLAPKLP